MFKADAVPVGPFTKGVNTRLPSFALGTDRLRNAVNVDLDNAGHAHRRAGAVKAVVGTAVRSVWFDGENGPGYFADGTALKTFTANGQPPFPATQLATVTAGAPIAFAHHGSDVFWSDGTLTGQIVNGVNQAWGITPAVLAPTLTQTVGSLFDGQYQATYTYVRANGEQSGAPMTSQITISNHNPANNGTAGIVIGGIVASSDPTVRAIKVYCTAANGTVPFCVATLPNASGSTVVTAIDPVAGEALATQFFTPPPAGTILFSHGARIYVVSGNVLYYSERFAPGWFGPAFNFLPFPAPISVALPVEDGIYIGTADTQYFLPGLDPDKLALRKVLRYGVVPGSGAVIRNGQQVAWMTPRGIVIAGPGGEVKAVQEDEIAVELAAQGIMGYREVNGMRQLVALLTGTQPTGMTHKDFVEQETRRLATVLPLG